MHWLLVVALLLSAAAGVVLVDLLRQKKWRESKRRFEEVLTGEEQSAWFAETGGERPATILDRLSQPRSIDLELRRAGWSAPALRAAYFIAATALPVAGLLAGGIWGAVAGEGPGEVAALAFLGLGAGYLAPRQILSWQARQRRKVIREEILVVLHLLRMLFNAGVSLEHALRVVSEQGKDLAPQLASELGIALVRINAGQDRADALDEMATPLNIPELDDTVAILRQATRYGGSLRESLERFANMIEDRRMASLREYVSKLSAKMTVVMVVFLFPALMIFLAGPGFLALGRALMRVQ